MKKRFKKFGIVFGLVFLTLFIALPGKANACIGVLGAPTFTECVVGLFEIIAQIFNFIFGIFFSLGVALVGVTMDFNLNVASLSNNTLLKVGWSASRDLANLGFVLVITIVAIATILRFQTYGAKALLPKLIGAAILINFSLTIASVFIGFSNVLTNFFMDKVGGVNNFPLVVADAFGPQKFLLPPQDPLPPNPADEANAIATFGAAMLSSITGLIFTVLFTLLAAVTMIILAFLLLMRYLYISFLLVLAPIVWLFWVFPALASHFNTWWKKFLTWVFFAPAASFFLYLSITAVKGMAANSTIQSSAAGNFSSSIIGQVMQHGMQMLVTAALVIFGIILAQNIGIAGATGALGLAKKTGIGVQKLTMKKAGRVGERVLTARMKTDEKGVTTTALERWGQGKFARTPIFGKLASGLAGLSTKARTSLQDQMQQAKAKADKEDGAVAASNAIRMARLPTVISQPQLAAEALRGIETGELDLSTVSDAVKQRIINAIKMTGQEAALLAYQPQLATEFYAKGTVVDKATGQKRQETDDEYKARAVGEAVKKYLKDATTLKPDVLEKITPYLQTYHLNQLGANGTYEQKLAVKNSLENSINQVISVSGLDGLRRQLDRTLKQIEDAKAKNDTVEVDRLLTKRDILKNSINAMIDKAQRSGKEYFTALQNRDGISENINWRDVFPKK